ncbi:HigA family addiction module antitoxin [Lysobacter sp. A289]
MRSVPYPHPGEILLEEFLAPLGISQYKLAKAIDVPQTRISSIVAGRRGITADTALRLARFFSTSDNFWMNLQVGHDAAQAKDELADVLVRIEPYAQAA